MTFFRRGVLLLGLVFFASALALSPCTSSFTGQIQAASELEPPSEEAIAHSAFTAVAAPPPLAFLIVHSPPAIGPGRAPAASIFKPPIG